MDDERRADQLERSNHRRTEPDPAEPPPAEPGGDGPDPLARLMAELDARAMDGDAVADQPPATVIVPELGITERSTVEIFGRMKSAKTFFVTDLFCSITAGVPWRGHELQPRRGLYLIGEGTPGLGARIRAWKYDRGVTALPNAIFQPTRLTLNRTEDFQALLAWVKARGPFGFVVVDTLARYSAGAEENSSQMQVVVDRAEAIRDAAGPDSPLIVVHHSGRGSQDHGRGHTSVEAACDLIVRTSIDGRRMSAEVLENRHGPAGTILRSTLEPVPEAREPGEHHDPAVIVPDLDTTSEFLPDSRRHVLDALVAIAIGDEWISSGRWHDATEGMPASTFHRAKKDLVLHGHVEVDDTTKHPRYRPTPPTDDTAATPADPSDQDF